MRWNTGSRYARTVRPAGTAVKKCARAEKETHSYERFRESRLGICADRAGGTTVLSSYYRSSAIIVQGTVQSIPQLEVTVCLNIRPHRKRWKWCDIEIVLSWCYLLSCIPRRIWLIDWLLALQLIISLASLLQQHLMFLPTLFISTQSGQLFTNALYSPIVSICPFRVFSKWRDFGGDVSCYSGLSRLFLV
jgi:hypothetical protein